MALDEVIGDPITQKLRGWCDALLDLSRRNPLLSLPARSVVAIPDLPDTLWALPENRAKGIRLVPTKVPSGDSDRVLKPNERGMNAQEFKSLGTLRLRARASLGEQGINILFIALGVLEWQEPTRSGTLRSPLLLLPVTLEKVEGDTAYMLYRYGDDPELNPTLKFRLAKPDIGIALPDMDDSNDFKPESYLSALSDVIATKKPEWRVSQEALLGRFSFLNLVMYKELEARLELARKHPLIAAIAGDRAVIASLPRPPVPALDTEPPRTQFAVLSADPSQEKAVLAARAGTNLVIQGPPGTGKTQTIANLIATCIADGKKVLFVSEKKAALDAVYKRLKERGLGSLCLEAHGYKASKGEILGQLRRAMDVPAPQKQAAVADTGVLALLRDEMNTAVAALHNRREPLEQSLYEARERIAELDGVPDLPFALGDTQTVDKTEIYKMESLAARLASFADLFDETQTHPWRSLIAQTYSAELHTGLQAALTQVKQVAGQLARGTSALWSEWGLPERDPATFFPRDSEWLSQTATALSGTPRPPRFWFAGDADLDTLRRVAVASAERYARFGFDTAELLGAFTPEIEGLPHTELVERMESSPRAVLSRRIGSDWADATDEFFADVSQCCENASSLVRHLQSSINRLAELVGTDAPQTLAQVSALVAALPILEANAKSCDAWFFTGVVADLSERARVARAKISDRDQARTAVSEVFEDGIYTLPLDELNARYANEYTTVLRFVKGSYWRDQKSLASVCKAGASFKNVPVTGLLQKAITVSRINAELSTETPLLRGLLGSGYEGDRTDWDALASALHQTAALVESFDGTVPKRLRELLTGAGAARGEARDQRSLAAEQRAATEAAFAALSERTKAASLSRPQSHTPLSHLCMESDVLHTTIADFVAARQSARTVARQPTPTGRLVAALRTAQRLADEGVAIAHESDKQHERFGALFAGLKTDWTAISSALTNVQTLGARFSGAGIREVPEPVAVAVCGEGGERLAVWRDAGARLAGENARFYAAWNALAVFLDTSILHQTVSEAEPFATQIRFVGAQIAVLGRIEQWVAFQSVYRECGRWGLQSFCDTVIAAGLSGETVERAFRRGFQRRWLESAGATAPAAATLCTMEHTTRAANFTRFDHRFLADTPVRIQKAMQDRRELTVGFASNIGEAGYLNRLLSQKKPRATVRKILAEIPNLLFRLTPCLMMSPLSVSLFLDPDRITFDIVVFDEASQVFPQFALGPLLRADQVVFAGDSYQLPPSSFFQRVEDSDDEGDEETSQTANPGEFESVLDAAVAAFETTTLNWHYRSRHESLIAFSNREIYTKYNSKGLDTFPSARVPSVVSYEYVPEGRYHGGKKTAADGRDSRRDNPVEAARVAALLVEQVRARPNESVGVITMSKAQAECVSAAVEEYTMLDGTLAALLNENDLENPDRFFVKAIEDVQGDERDAIFLSIGYGKWASDDRVRLSFGPLNTRSEKQPSPGEQRLNVAVTRAKSRMTVVSSLQPGDIPASGASPGAMMLRAFLEYARSETGLGQGGAPQSDDGFVEAVAAALERRGHTVRREIGTARYRVDLGIVSADDPQTFALGIECDGANYESGETARAREWLRASVLKGLGWRLHRVWSADWLRDPAAVLDSIDAALRDETASLAPTDAVEPEPTPTEDTHETPTTPPLPHQTPAPKDIMIPGLSYFDECKVPLAGGQATLYGYETADAIAREDLVFQIVQTEEPVHSGVVASRLCRAAGFARTGAKIQLIAGEALEVLLAADRVEIKEDFVRVKESQTTPARIPRFGDTPRPVEQISLAEIGAIALCVVRAGGGMRLSEAVTESARHLGFKSTSAAIRERLEKAIAALEYDNRLHNFGGQLRILDA